MRTDTIVERLRKYAAGRESITRSELPAALGVTARQAHSAVDTLVASKELERAARGTYRLVGSRSARCENPVEDRVWHAMRINPRWTCSDIALQTGASLPYIFTLLMAYRAAGYVRQMGRTESLRGTVRVWTLTSAARSMLVRPKVELYTPDPLVVAAVKLNRLVSTGLIKFDDPRAEALRLCAEIMSRLQPSETR